MNNQATERWVWSQTSILLMLFIYLYGVPFRASPASSGLQFDAYNKSVAVSSGTISTSVVYHFTNTLKQPLSITKVSTSCGCSTAKIPETPWIIPPQTNASIQIQFDLRGRRGRLIKSAFVTTTKGLTVLTTTVDIGMAASQPAITPSSPSVAKRPAVTTKPPRAKPVARNNRGRNILIAKADRQAVFKNDCAQCHAEPTKGRHGGELFAAACGICHEAVHRASIVPDLGQLKLPLQQWKQVVADGKPNSLMPAFAKQLGGPLTTNQIDSLAEFLAARPVISAATR